MEVGCEMQVPSRGRQVHPGGADVVVVAAP
jgi:hypothetical protein